MCFRTCSWLFYNYWNILWPLKVSWKAAVYQKDRWWVAWCFTCVRSLRLSCAHCEEGSMGFWVRCLFTSAGCHWLWDLVLLFTGCSVLLKSVNLVNKQQVVVVQRSETVIRSVKNSTIDCRTVIAIPAMCGILITWTCIIFFLLWIQMQLIIWLLPQSRYYITPPVTY